MAEYIELKKAIEEFTFADADVCQEYADYECEFGFSREAIKQVLEQMPADDVVPVVRCRECKKSSYDALYMRRWCNRTLSCVRVKDDDFCSYGERLTNYSTEK